MRLSQMLLARSRWLASAVARELGGSLASNYREQARASEGEPRPIFIASERGRASEPKNLRERARPSSSLALARSRIFVATSSSLARPRSRFSAREPSSREQNKVGNFQFWQSHLGIFNFFPLLFGFYFLVYLLIWKLQSQMKIPQCKM